MRSRSVMVAVAFVALVAFVAGASMAAGPKQYQFTGEVKEIDAKAKTISVDKAGDVWEFSMNGVKTTAKKGDKVTVYYTMIAKKIEAK